MRKQIKLIRSASGRGQNQSANLKALRLKKIGDISVVEYTEDWAGRIEKVKHLVCVEDVV